MLVKVLAGVFDPPPAALAVPWAYLGAVASAALAAVALRRLARCGSPDGRPWPPSGISRSPILCPVRSRRLPGS
ncbi:MAG: hypothetical protein LC749_13725 [Actinobacteria bacterium]|nr:hypothetical protein [Actinomycetota bacterium]